MTRKLLTAGLIGAAATLMAAALAAIPARAEAASAQVQTTDDPFSSLVGKRRERAARDAHEIERYVTTTGEREFLLETDGDAARIKFLCSENDPRLDCRIDPEGPAEEIFLLTTMRASRGELLFRDSEGGTVLRIAPHGGATVNWPGELTEKGASKSYTDETGPLALAPAHRSAAHRRAQGAAAHLSALTGSPIVFDVGVPADLLASAAIAPPAELSARQSFAAAAPAAVSDRLAADSFAESESPADEADELGADESAADESDADQNAPVRRRRDATVLADAVARVAGGMHLVASDPTGARVIGARIAVVRFVERAAAGLSLDGDVLTVFYNPRSGLGGRPSSTAVAKYLEDAL
ncbi:MAG: DUF4908 domain-containing protein [Amphiplicatus sp.]